MIKELTIRGDFTVEGLPDRVSTKLKYLRIKAKVVPEALLCVEAFSSIDKHKGDK